MSIIFAALIVLATVAFFTGVLIIVANIATATLGRAGVARRLSAIDSVYGAGGREAAAAERAGAPAGVSNRMTKLGRAATPSTGLARLRRLLDYAGNPPYWTVDRVFEVKGLGLISVGVVGAVIGLAVGASSVVLIGGLLGAAAGFFIPDLVLHDVSQRRQDQIRRTLPDILDIHTLSVEAGLSFDSALGQITRYGRGPLAGEIARLLQEIQLGRSRVDSLRALAQRTNVSELKAFCAIVIQASELGVPIANVLREQAREMRIRRRQRAEEQAQKIPIKILFPLIFCLFPAIFIVVLGPGIINILRVFNR